MPPGNMYIDDQIFEKEIKEVNSIDQLHPPNNLGLNIDDNPKIVSDRDTTRNFDETDSDDNKGCPDLVTRLIAFFISFIVIGVIIAAIYFATKNSKNNEVKPPVISSAADCLLGYKFIEDKCIL